ncbi:MAG: PKD domain-containing protein [Candidatus Bathyarchaeia archaeon]
MNKIATSTVLTLLLPCLPSGIILVIPVMAIKDGMDQLRVNVLLDYGNETCSWRFGVLLSETTTVLDATLAVATVNYTLWGGDVFVDAISELWNSHPHYWVWWLWNNTEWKWTLGPVACNNFTLKNGDVIAWYYENCTDWPPPPPNKTMQKVNILIDYGNETRTWYDEVVLPVNATPFDATLAIATVNYTDYGAGLGFFVDAINELWNSNPYYWMWWYWNKTESSWALGSVACNFYTLSDGDVMAWYYENCSVWPPPPPTFSASINPATAKIKVGESVVFKSSVLGGKPPYAYQWYLNESVILGAKSPTWNFTPTATGTYIVYLIVTDNITNTAKSNEATITVASKLITSISPVNASMLVGQSITFTSTASGGYPPYNYQWCLNDASVLGANTSTWTFTPATSGIYFVHLKVTDAEGNIAQSETARVSVATVPVGGYSISMKEQTKQVMSYLALMAILAMAFATIKPRDKTCNA